MGNHRAAGGKRRATSAAPSVSTPRSTHAGKRRAAAPARSGLRDSLPSLSFSLPSAPLVAGVAVLAVAAGGALSFADTGAGSLADKAALASAKLPGASDFDTEKLLASRGEIVSRSAARTVVSDSLEDDPEFAALTAEQEKRQEEALAAINKNAEKRAATIAENRWVLPVVGYRLSATFGQSSYLWSTVHTGLDFSAPYGSDLVAVANGTITSTGYDGSYGNKTVLTLDDGTEIWYCHQSSFGVSVGDRVTGGEVIGAVGSTGNSTGNHLHLEVRPGAGDPINPYTALQEHGVQP